MQSVTNKRDEGQLSSSNYSIVPLLSITHHIGKAMDIWTRMYLSFQAYCQGGPLLSF